MGVCRSGTVTVNIVKTQTQGLENRNRREVMSVNSTTARDMGIVSLRSDDQYYDAENVELCEKACRF